MVINPSTIISTLNLSMIALLLVSIFFFSKSYVKTTKNTYLLSTCTTGMEMLKKGSTSTLKFSMGPFIMKVLKLLALLSIPSLIISIYSDFQNIKITFSLWLKKTPTKISLKFLYDQYFLVFLTVALMVTWSMMEFSYYYMSEDPKKTAFFRLLTIFLLKMLMLTCSKSLFLIFLGWEGVGFLSFLLISWWSTRKDASSSALEAVIYNRMGDMGLMLFMALAILVFKSWNLSELLSLAKDSAFTPFMLFGLMLAAAGKSAQFGLHPWLPAAMEGPTPVSALLHSSTMVVAGVFLLVRTSELFYSSPPIQTMLLLLGGLTAMFAASTAMAQHDIKKMIAYSTTSQLGLMITAMGIGSPLLALFHMCTHAFFKAMLFLCSGSMMHSLSDEQDLRKMSGLSYLLPMTSACLALGSLALMGTPFLSGFYSKDLILEATGASLMKTLGLVLSLAATLLTAAYSFRIVLFCFLSSASIAPMSPMGEENHNLTKALLRLAAGTMMAGWFFSNFVFNSPSFIVPSMMKSLPLMVTILGVVLLLSLLTFLITTMTNSTTHKSLTQQWFYVDVSHTLSTLFVFFSSLFMASRTLDRGWQEETGPQGLGTISTFISKENQNTQSGLMKRYIFSSVLFMLLMMTLSFLFTS